MAEVIADFNAGAGKGGLYAADAAFATARGAATGSADNGEGPKADAIAGYEINRYFIPTDFTTIPAGSTVTAAVLYYYPTTRNTTDDDTFKVILTTQADPASLAAGDYDNITLNTPTTYGTSAAFSGMTLNAYNTITLTEAARTLIQDAAGVGYVKFGLRATGDIDNSQPSGRSYFNWDLSAHNVYIKVTYDEPLPSVAGGYAFFM